MRGKRFPCGHPVSLHSLLICCNFFGDATWTPGPHFLSCAQPAAVCSETLECPKLPDPRVLDGLQMRLDLIEWSFNKDAPTELDRNKVGLLRAVLSRIGHLDREPGTTDVAADLAPSRPSESSLTQTLVHVELEALGLRAWNVGKSAEVASRGGEPYCSYRDAIPAAGQSQLLYHMPSPGQHCECVTPHDLRREASSWALTPAETVDPGGPEEPTDATPGKRNGKTVRFAAPVVTEVQYFEAWWCDEYRDSGRYWSTGPHRRSIDLSTPTDDDCEIARLENGEARAAQTTRELDGRESARGAAVEDAEDGDHGRLDGMERARDDDGVSGEIERDDEACDDDKALEEIEEDDESWDEETLDGLGDHDESWQEFF